MISVVAQTTVFAYFLVQKAESVVVTITVSASNRKIRDTTKSSLTAVYLPTVNYAAINLQSLLVFWFFSSFKSNNVKLLTPNYGTMPTQSKN
ncbi:hypothetical protein [Nostoc sp.]|uniref:hypothetical protein n=1 Tax=Nostoc sp. TaxID=1180 RepID=UPI002FF8A237